MSIVPVEEMRPLFLFEGLPEDQLQFISERTERKTFDAGAWVYREGDPAIHLVVLLEGAVRLLRKANGEDVVINETDQRGVYAGATRGYLDEADQRYVTSMSAVVPSSFLCLHADDFSAYVHKYMPMAAHLLEGLYLGMRYGEGTVRERENLARLGALSANLGHELNNPAAAASRATSQLRKRVSDMRNKLAMIADGHVSPERMHQLVEFQQDIVAKMAVDTETRTSLAEADLEDTLVDRLDELGVAGGLDLAPIFASAGLDVGWLNGVIESMGDVERDGPLRWLAYTLESEQLMDEIEDATSRISTLVAAVKQYSYMDTASVQDIDVVVGLEATVVMMGHKLGGVTVVRDYQEDAPKIPTYPAELNQVWTNLIHNAVQAMDGKGTLTLRTAVDGANLVIEVQDDGPGIPPDVQPRIWEAFFTTKPPGEGSGLGLDTVRRIVERRHHGKIDFVTGDGGTTFSVRLPLEQRLS
jgi:signal transduction histidine kinase